MQFDAARIDLAEYIRPLWETKYPAIELITENSKPVDLTKRIEPFLQLTMRYSGRSSQLNMNGNNPLTRFPGRAVFQLFVKEFTGKKQIGQGLDFLSNTLAYKQIGLLLLKHPVPMPDSDAVGWYKGVLALPFQFDTLRQST